MTQTIWPPATTTTEVAARRQMVEMQCRARGIHDESVLAVMADLPRELFVHSSITYSAYDDRALSIGWDQTISQPYIVALMTAALELRPEHVVLEIGTGSGYQTAILARLARHVHTVERIGELSRLARERVQALGIENVTYFVGDGSAGWPMAAPYDRIIITAGTPRLSPRLIDQLAARGRLVAPVGEENCQTLVTVERFVDRYVERPLLPCRFVKLIGEGGWPDG